MLPVFGDFNKFVMLYRTIVDLTLYTKWKVAYTLWTEEKHTKMFLSYIPQNPVDSDKIWYILSWINLRYSIFSSPE